MQQLKPHKEQFDQKRIQWGEAYNDLHGDPRFDKLIEMEHEVMRSLAAAISDLTPSETEDYSHEVAYRNGIVAGIRTLQNYRANCYGEFQRLSDLEKQPSQPKGENNVNKKTKTTRSIY